MGLGSPVFRPLLVQGRLLFLAVISIIFTIAGITVPIVNSRVVETIEKSSRYEPSLNLNQMKASIAQFDARAAQYGGDPSARRLRALRNARAVLISWTTDFHQGQLGAYVKASASRQQMSNEIVALIGDLSRIADAPDAGTIATASEETTQKIEPVISALSQEVLSDASELYVRDHEAILINQRLQMAMLIGVVTSGVGLLLFISRQNSELRQMHREQETLTQKFERVSIHDPLTGLLNRNGFEPLVSDACARAKLSGDQVAMLSLDLDQFKVINDVFGHAAGDSLLVSAARCLAATEFPGVRLKAARLGGDEFAVLIEAPQATDKAENIANDIVRRMREPHAVGHVSLTTDTSVGVAFAPAHGSEADDIMFASDIALYRAKSAGRGQVRVYRQSDGDRGLGRQTLELRLKQALTREEFEPYYQPQIDFRTNRVVAVEALIRWRHDGVLLSPAEFLPFAESNGLIVDLDRALLSKVCADLVHIPEPIRVSVNMSVAQIFCDDVVDAFLSRLTHANVAPGRIEVEITETMFLTNAARAANVMNALQNAGVSIALDDFGNGYSSLGYLRRFRFDKLKIDKIFVESLAPGSKELEILRLVSALGKALNQSVIAEGIETDEQSRLVQLAGCDCGQGYFFARPMPLPELIKFIEKQNMQVDRPVEGNSRRELIHEVKSV